MLEPITPSLIKEIRDKIVEYLNPDKIILFGSATQENNQKAHDIDIYVIKPGISDVRQAERNIDELFAGRFFALDVMVRTPEQVEKSLKSGNSFLKQEILGKGQVLYARQ